MKIMLWTIAFTFLMGCINQTERKSYYKDGNIKIIETVIDDNFVLQKHFYESGEKRIECEVYDSHLNGEFREYYKNGESKYQIDYKLGKKTGISKYFNESGSLEHINLFFGDSLYFIEEYDLNDTTEFIKPIISLESVDSVKNKYTLNIAIPFEDFFKYRDDTIVVHYDIVHLVEGDAYYLPRKNNVKLYRGNETELIDFIPSDKELSYTIQGLVTVNDEPLKNFSQHFFQYTFID